MRFKLIFFGFVVSMLIDQPAIWSMEKEQREASVWACPNFVSVVVPEEQPNTSPMNSVAYLTQVLYLGACPNLVSEIMRETWVRHVRQVYPDYRISPLHLDLLMGMSLYGFTWAMYILPGTDMAMQLSLPLIPGMIRSASRLLGYSDFTSTAVANVAAMLVGASQDLNCRGIYMKHVFESAIALSQNIELSPIVKALTHNVALLTGTLGGSFVSYIAALQTSLYPPQVSGRTRMR